MSRQETSTILQRNIDVLTLFFCEKPLTGYALIGEIEHMFGVRLSSGIVYHSLMRLERDRLLDHTIVNGNRGRQACSYTVTEKGKKCLSEYIAVLSSISRRIRES